MEMKNIAFGITDWAEAVPTEHKGEAGIAIWRTRRFDNIRVRMVEYSAGYLADHWCKKGHIVHCLEGEVLNEQENGEKHLLKVGMTYIVSDDLSSHRSFAKENVKLLIIDGDFLK